MESHKVPMENFTFISLMEIPQSMKPGPLFCRIALFCFTRVSV